MHAIGVLHVSLALAAVGTGAAVLRAEKGTRRHRRLGRIYALAMLGLNASALLIYRLFGRFGPFHILALVSLATLAAGVLPAWRKRPTGAWLARHYWFMTWSYVGLLAAFAAELAVRLPLVGAPGRHGPGLAFALAALVASAVVSGIGGALIARRRPAPLGRAGS